MIKTFNIPDEYYENGTPIVERTPSGEYAGITYIPDAEIQFNLAGAYGPAEGGCYTLTVGITSPYIVGKEFMGKDMEVVSVNIEKRLVTVWIKEGTQHD